ncbi:type II toxin-antitoxin system ParD family antitoxin [Jiella sp. M17.18]|uniref:ribbon-helix-helix domain-containing protein n=1 Tax=Jiella sp. M17.18 TaxID=3234247 RepID=UPI0034DF0458
MAANTEFRIVLPDDLAEMAESKVASGDYQSISEVVGDGMRALAERDAAIDRWLLEEVVPGHQEYLADPSAAIPADEILDWIKRRPPAAG